jgi:hypothetical protein
MYLLKWTHHDGAIRSDPFRLHSFSQFFFSICKIIKMANQITNKGSHHLKNQVGVDFYET